MEHNTTDLGQCSGLVIEYTPRITCYRELGGSGNSQCFYPVKCRRYHGTVIIGGMIWITRSNVKFRIWVKSEGPFIENNS